MYGYLFFVFPLLLHPFLILSYYFAETRGERDYMTCLFLLPFFQRFNLLSDTFGLKNDPQTERQKRKWNSLWVCACVALRTQENSTTRLLARHEKLILDRRTQVLTKNIDTEYIHTQRVIRLKTYNLTSFGHRGQSSIPSPPASRIGGTGTIHIDLQHRYNKRIHVQTHTDHIHSSSTHNAQVKTHNFSRCFPLCLSHSSLLSLPFLSNVPLGSLLSLSPCISLNSSLVSLFW